MRFHLFSLPKPDHLAGFTICICLARFASRNKYSIKVPISDVNAVSQHAEVQDIKSRLQFPPQRTTETENERLEPKVPP
jgi:hypothetical protein